MTDDIKAVCLVVTSHSGICGADHETSNEMGPINQNHIKTDILFLIYELIKLWYFQRETSETEVVHVSHIIITLASTHHPDDF